MQQHRTAGSTDSVTDYCQATQWVLDLVGAVAPLLRSLSDANDYDRPLRWLHHHHRNASLHRSGSCAVGAAQQPIVAEMDDIRHHVSPCAHRQLYRYRSPPIMPDTGAPRLGRPQAMELSLHGMDGNGETFLLPLLRASEGL